MQYVAGGGSLKHKADQIMSNTRRHECLNQPDESPSGLTESVGRRRFMTAGMTTMATAAAIGASASNAAEADRSNAPVSRLPREVAIVTVSQDGLRASTPEQMVKKMLGRCEQAAHQRPDLVCLPEVFPFANLEGGRPSLESVAAPPLCPLTRPVSEFAKQHQCYVVCPTYTVHNGRYFNTAVLFDRSGGVAGEYHKIRLTPTEVEKGLTPGPEEPPVFQADFGTVACQICFDIEWLDGWKRLSRSGAEIVVWPSAFAGGRMIGMMAALNRYVVVSSTRKDASQVCDVDGTQLATTSRWNDWVMATVNLEKAFLHTWPFVQRFPDVLAKYGDAVRIKTHADEEWSIIESRSADLRIQDVLDEFDLQPINAYLAASEKLQREARRKTS